jgi:hypothetical protein
MKGEKILLMLVAIAMCNQSLAQSYMELACKQERNKNIKIYNSLSKGMVGRTSRIVESLKQGIDYEYEENKKEIKKIQEHYKKLVENFDRSKAGIQIQALSYELGVKDMKKRMEKLASSFKADWNPHAECLPIKVNDDGEVTTIKRVPYVHRDKKTCARISYKVRRRRGRLTKETRLHKRDRSIPSVSYTPMKLSIGSNVYKAVHFLNGNRTLLASEVVLADDRYMEPGEEVAFSQTKPFNTGYAAAEVDGFAPTAIGNGLVEETWRTGTYGNVWLENYKRGSNTPYIAFCEKKYLKENVERNHWGELEWSKGYYSKACSTRAYLLKAPAFTLKKCATVAAIDVTEDQYDDEEIPRRKVCVSRDLISDVTTISGGGYTKEVAQYRKQYQSLDKFLADRIDPYCLAPKVSKKVVDKSRDRTGEQTGTISQDRNTAAGSKTK